MNTASQSPAAPSLLGNYVATLRNFADFNGRARRSEYWYYVLVNFLVSMALTTLGIFLNLPQFFGTLNLLFNLVILLPSVAVSVRRMHDVGKPGWYVLVPVYNFILACTEGTRGENEYGPDPKK